jgi:hypothetical protein
MGQRRRAGGSAQRAGPARGCPDEGEDAGGERSGDSAVGLSGDVADGLSGDVADGLSGDVADGLSGDDDEAAFEALLDDDGGDEDAITGLERRRGPGRRLSDFSRAAEEGEMTREQFLFLIAVDEFKKGNEVQFPSWSDVLEIVRLLGYRKTMKSELNLPRAEDWRERPIGPSGVRLGESSMLTC